MPGFHLPKNADVTPQVPMVDMRNGETSGERDNYLARSRQCNSVSIIKLYLYELKIKANRQTAKLKYYCFSAR